MKFKITDGVLKQKRSGSCSTFLGIFLFLITFSILVMSLETFNELTLNRTLIPLYGGILFILLLSVILITSTSNFIIDKKESKIYKIKKVLFYEKKEEIELADFTRLGITKAIESRPNSTRTIYPVELLGHDDARERIAITTDHSQAVIISEKLSNFLNYDVYDFSSDTARINNTGTMEQSSINPIE